MPGAGEVEAERIVLAHYLIRRAADIRAAQVTSEHFFQGQHAVWWSAAENAPQGWTPGDLGIPPDTMALLAAIRPMPRDVTQAENRMVRRWQVVYVQRACRALDDEIKSGSMGKAEEVLDQLRIALSEAEAGGVLEARTHREAGIALFNDWSEAIKDGTTRNLPMPLPGLQRRLGGWRPGKFYLIGAVTSGHKTTFGRMAAWHLAKQGIPTLFWTMEDSAEEMAARTFAAEIRQVDTRTFTSYEKPQGITEGDFEDMLRALGKHLDDPASLMLRYLDEPGPKLRRVLARVSSEVARGAKAVVLDFMQLIQADRDDTQETQHWFKVSNALAAMAKRFDIALIATVQPTQLATREQARLKRPLTLGDLRGGSAIAQSAYGVALLNRVWDEEGEWDRRFIDVSIEKWKNADVQTVRFNVERHKDLIRERD